MSYPLLTVSINTKACRLVQCLLEHARSTVLVLPLIKMSENKEQLTNEILQYLVDHPNAQDTLNGVVNWWLLGRTIKPRTALVEEVLNKLVADRLVIAQHGSDSQTTFKLNIRKRKQIIANIRRKS